MPWSPWQAPLLSDTPGVTTRINSDSNFPGSHGIVQATTANLGLSSVVFRDNTGDSNGRADLLQSQYPPDWQTSRNWFPALLQGLVQGVDYGPRPDRNPLTDNDAYVEYADGPNADLGWVMPSVQIQPLVNVDDTNHPASGTATGTLELLASSYPTTAGTDVGPLPTGTPIRTVGVGEGGTFTPAAPAFTSFSLVLATSSVDIPVNTHIGWGVTLSFFPRQRTQSPMWRYWIPDSTHPLPLRQRQRDDGLGLSGTPRWRGGNSRQSSNRWRAYL